MIKLGVVGLGGRIRHVINRVLKTLAEDVHVVGVVDPDREGARARLDEADRNDVVFYDDLDSMVRKGGLDGLAVGTRCNLHAPYAIQAAAYDLPLFLEKPVAIDMDQAVALKKAFSNSRCPVVVGFPLRVSPVCELTAESIRAGFAGRPEHILAVNYVSYGTGYFGGPYRNNKVTHGLLLQKATHDLDYMMYLMDSPIVRVAAMASYGRVFGGDKPPGLRCSACDEADTCPESPANRRKSGNPDAKDHLCVFGSDLGTPETFMNEDADNVLVQFANGAQGSYTQVFFARRDSNARGATITGYKGTLSFDFHSGECRRVHHHRPFTETVRAQDTSGGGHFGGDHELASDFLDLIRGKIRTSRTPIETGLRSVYTCLAARESSLTDKFVEVRPV